MDPLSVQVFGRLAENDKDELAREIDRLFARDEIGCPRLQDGSLTFVEEYPTQLDARPCLVRVIVLSNDDGDLWKSARLFLEHLKQAAHLPVVFVGVPPSMRLRFHVAGVAWHVAERDWVKVARTIERAAKSNWWWTVGAADLPVMIVNREGAIIEANTASRDLFGPDIVGRPYRLAVEDPGGDPVLGEGHPILEALDPGRGAAGHLNLVGKSRYHNVTDSQGKVVRRSRLVCFPLANLGREVTSVVVFYIDLGHFDRIVEAARAFARIADAESLMDEIARQVNLMGYSRVRFYEYLPAERVLIGRRGIGFRDPEKARRFVGRRMETSRDPESHNTIERGFPSLFIYDDQPRVEPESDLVHYCRRQDDGEDLEKRDVGRWVDVPILIPSTDDSGRPSIRAWGKLSVDDGPRSSRLTPRDVANVTAIAAIAGGAAAEKIRARRDKELLDIYQEYTRKLDTAEWRVSGDRITPKVLALLLELFHKLFQFDLTFYREFHPESRILRFRGLAYHEPGAFPDDCEIPREIGVGDFPSYDIFGSDRVDSQGAVLPGASIEHFRHDHATMVMDEVLRRRTWNESEKRYLRWIGSEIGIPIVVRNRVRGVLIGLSRRTNHFPADSDVVLSRFRSAAQFWFQIGDLQDARTTSVRTLGDCLRAWAELQEAKIDEGVYAGLIAILTAGCGLGWNRAMIFRCRQDGSRSAELVYGVGGLGEKTHPERVQRAVERSEPDLVELVRRRIRHPRFDDVEPDRIDTLYRQYVSVPERRPELSTSPADSPLSSIVTDDPASDLRYLSLDRDDKFIANLNAKYPNLFPARTTYFFPLISNHADDGGLLGFVALDNHYRPNALIDTVLSLTLAIVELVRDFIEMQLRLRIMSGMLGALPFIRHGPNIKAAWDDFRPEADALLERVRTLLDSRNSAVPDDVRPLLNATSEGLSRLDEPVQNLAAAQTQVDAWRDLAISSAGIPDLRKYLIDLMNAWTYHRGIRFVDANRNDVDPSRLIDLPDAVGLPCERLLLDNALRCLLENARSFSTPDADGRLPVMLSASRRSDVRPFAQVITIRVRDFGPGIDPDRIPFLFIDGYSDREGLVEPPDPGALRSEHRGRGLGMVRACLLRERGEILLEDHGRPGRGATFAIHFAIHEASRLNSPHSS